MVRSILIIIALAFALALGGCDDKTQPVNNDNLPPLVEYAD